MKAILSILVGASALAVVTAATADDSIVTGEIIRSTALQEQPLFRSSPEPGYIAYPGYVGAPPDSHCYWTRMPIYDADRAIIGWRERTVAVCPNARMSAQAGK